jgi:hypothetical protein
MRDKGLLTTIQAQGLRDKDEGQGFSHNDSGTRIEGQGMRDKG